MVARPVWQEPEIELQEWSIIVHPHDGGAYFAGVRHDAERGRERGRMSTMIESFDASTITGRTYSGRVYRLAADGRRDIHGILLVSVFWGEAATHVTFISPRELELLLAGPANGIRC